MGVHPGLPAGAASTLQGGGGVVGVHPGLPAGAASILQGGSGVVGVVVDGAGNELHICIRGYSCFVLFPRPRRRLACRDLAWGVHCLGMLFAFY